MNRIESRSAAAGSEMMFRVDYSIMLLEHLTTHSSAFGFQRESVDRQTA